MSFQSLSPSIRTLHVARMPVATIFLFSYAGGSARIFQPWALHVPADFDVRCVELPGHGDRFGEEPFRRIDLLISVLASEFQSCTSGYYGFFGHSMGALVAFE